MTSNDSSRSGRNRHHLHSNNAELNSSYFQMQWVLNMVLMQEILNSSNAFRNIISFHIHQNYSGEKFIKIYLFWIHSRTTAVFQLCLPPVLTRNFVHNFNTEENILTDFTIQWSFIVWQKQAPFTFNNAEINTSYFQM